MEMMYMMMQQLVDSGQKRENDANMVRLNALEMPHFTGKVGEDLYRFVDQISHFLNNYVRPTEWVARLKASVQKDQRAYDSVVTTERTYAYLLRTQPDPVTGQYRSPTREQWLNYYAAITEKLMVDRGMAWEERLRILIVEFQQMAQSQYEWVTEYAHRFRENDHMLCKFIPNHARHWVHDRRFPEGGYWSDLELRTKFMLGLRKTISKELSFPGRPVPITGTGFRGCEQVRVSVSADRSGKSG